ncbi:MAG: hypothetical protein JEY96_14195 [Bacteroidales bacterium]|nr:hypothetical protein [Bacteroidales bacterium]
MNGLNKNKSKNKSLLFLGVISFAIILLISSCEEDPSSIGSDILPDGDKIVTLYDTTFSFHNQVFKKEPFITSNISHHSLGISNDPYFGELKSQMASEFFYFALDTNMSTYYVDSLMLYLSVDSTYGSPQETVSFNVYELNTLIVDDSSHYSNESVSDLYSEADKINETFQVRGDTLLAFNLKNEFAQRLLSDTLFYLSDTAFKEEFKGLAVVPSIASASDLGGTFLVNIATTDTKIVLYYHTDTVDSLYFNYTFTRGNRFTQYSYDYSSSEVNAYLTNPEDENDDLIFIQGVDGISSRIEYTDLDTWLNENATYSILKAELITSVVNDQDIETFYPPEKLSLNYAEEDSTIIYLEDYTSTGMFGGSYNSTDEIYNFNISKHFSDIVNHNIEDHYLNFDVVNSYTSPHRVILKAGEDIKMKVTYTKHE